MYDFSQHDTNRVTITVWLNDGHNNSACCGSVTTNQLKIPSHADIPRQSHLLGLAVQIVGVLKAGAVCDDFVRQLLGVGVEVAGEEQQVGARGGQSHKLGAVEALHQPVAAVYVTRLVVVGVQLRQHMTVEGYIGGSECQRKTCHGDENVVVLLTYIAEWRELQTMEQWRSARPSITPDRRFLNTYL